MLVRTGTVLSQPADRSGYAVRLLQAESRRLNGKLLMGRVISLEIRNSNPQLAA